MALGMAFFAGIIGTFYYSRFAAHRKDDQTCASFDTLLCLRQRIRTTANPGITRHGQQPGNAVHQNSRGPRLVASGNTVEVDGGDSRRLPLPGNDVGRGSETVREQVMSVVAVSPHSSAPGRLTNAFCGCHPKGRGLDPNGEAPSEPGNMPQPAPQRRNEDGSHYTKVRWGQRIVRNLFTCADRLVTSPSHTKNGRRILMRQRRGGLEEPCEHTQLEQSML